MMNTSFAYNSTIVNFGVPGQPAEHRHRRRSARIRPTATQRNGFQYDYPTAGSGIGNVYVNAKWLFKLSGLYQLPFDVNVSAFYNARQGYPFEAIRPDADAAPTAPAAPTSCSTRSATTACRTTRTSTSTSSVRFASGRPLRPVAGRVQLSNNNTVQAIRSRQNAANANQIQAILAPRVLRFGIRVNW